MTILSRFVNVRLVARICEAQRNLSLCLGESLRDRGWQRQQMGENNGEGRQQGGGRREEKVGNKKQNEKNQLRAEGSVNVRRGGSK